MNGNKESFQIDYMAMTAWVLGGFLMPYLMVRLAFHLKFISFSRIIIPKLCKGID